MNEAMKKLDKGELVKDEVLNTTVLMRLMEDDCKNGFVLDGYPGSVEQAVYLDGLLAARNIDSLEIVLLDISDEIALEKMANRGRPQDKGGFAEKRLELFRDNVESLGLVVVLEILQIFSGAAAQFDHGVRVGVKFLNRGVQMPGMSLVVSEVVEGVVKSG